MSRMDRNDGGRGQADRGPEPGNPSLEEARGAHRQRTALRALSSLYAQADAAWSAFRCPGSAECCQLSKQGREPWLWGVEWDALRRAVPDLPPPRADGGCRFLDSEGRRCTVYAARPLGCRTYFCHRASGPAHEPTGAMNRLQRRLETIARDLRPEEEGPRPITRWFEDPAR